MEENVKIQTEQEVYTSTETAITATETQDLDVQQETALQLEKDEQFALVPVDDDIFESDISQEAFEAANKATLQCEFVPVQNMKRILSWGCSMGGVYAKRVDMGGGKNESKIIMLYNDGSSSEEITISNAEIFIPMQGNFGIQSEDGSLLKSDIRNAEKIIEKIKMRLLPYWRNELAFSIPTLLQKLAQEYTNLPVDTSGTITIELVYAYLVEFMKKSGNHITKELMTRKGYYAITEDVFQEIAERFILSTSNMAKFLRQHNLLHLQPTSRGYQSNVADFGWCYCIRMLRCTEKDAIVIPMSDCVL